MPRTHIITGDGTRFVAQGANRRLIGRFLGGIALVITALVLSAAVIGLQRAAIAPNTPSLPLPKAVLRACEGLKGQYLGACIGLALRPAYDIDNTHTPNGIALVKECRSQYRGEELIICLTQPIN